MPKKAKKSKLTPEQQAAKKEAEVCPKSIDPHLLARNCWLCIAV
jgi:hypothetical protein